MADTERQCQLMERDDGGISSPAFQATDILLAKAGDVGKLLLRQAFLLPDSPYIPPHQFAHVHAQRSADYIL